MAGVSRTLSIHGLKGRRCFIPAIIPFIPAIIGAGASIAGGALSNRSSSQQTQTPTLDPRFQPLQNQILTMVGNRLNQPTDLSGYQREGIGTINRTSALTKQASDNSLTARGLSTSPVAANVDAVREAGRTSSIASLNNSLPLIQRDLQNQDLQLASGVLGQGRGLNVTGSTSSGGGPAGAATNLAGYIGYLQGNGAFNRTPSGAGPGSGSLPQDQWGSQNWG